MCKSTIRTLRLRALASSPHACDRANYGRSRSSYNNAAPATSDIDTESKKLMHLLQEGSRICWTHAFTDDPLVEEVLVQFCRAHKLSPDACWLSLKDEQVSLDKTLQEVNGTICCLVVMCFFDQVTQACLSSAILLQQGVS